MNPIIKADSIQIWYVDDKLHRIDGPAVIRADGTQEWCVDGENISNDVFDWCRDDNFGDYITWDSYTKILFKLKFLGAS